jgi:hypothetical protein
VLLSGVYFIAMIKKTPSPESASELYPPSDRRLPAKSVSISSMPYRSSDLIWINRMRNKSNQLLRIEGCRVVSATDPPWPNLGFLDRIIAMIYYFILYYFLQSLFCHYLFPQIHAT